MYTYPLGDHLVLLDTCNDSVQVANPVAACIKTMSCEGHLPDAIAEHIAAEYALAKTAVLADVKAFLASGEPAAASTFKPIEDYLPVTDFVPDAPLQPVATNSFYLPGFRIEVAAESAAVFDHLGPLFSLPRGLSDAENVLRLEVYDDNGRYPIVHNGACLDTGFDLADAAIKCMREATVLATRYHPWLIIIHAAAVARGSSGILIPAVGGSGKTTLSAYLMARGYGYLNDDVVPLLKGARNLSPVPASLSIKRGSWNVLAAEFPELAGLPEYGRGERCLKYLPPQSHQVCTQPVRCRVVLLPDYSPATTGVTVEAVSAVDVFQDIIEGGCSIKRPVQPQELQSVVAWLHDMPCYRISYSQLDQAHQGIEGLLNNLPDLT